MSVLASVAIATNIIDQTLFVIGMTLAGTTFVLCIFMFAYDCRRYYRERSQGKDSVWYKRPAILFSEALLLLAISEMINQLRLGNFISATLLFYMCVFTLPIIGIILLGYSFVQNTRKRRL